MNDRIISSRPSLEQVTAIVDFMERHPALGQGTLRGLEGREESKKLWLKLTRIANNTSGPNRTMKSWMKYWADKKSTVRSKVFQGGGDPNNLGSNVEKKIYDLFIANDCGSNSSIQEKRISKPHKRKIDQKSVKQETTFVDQSFYDEESMDENHAEVEPALSFEEPTTDNNIDDRQTSLMEKLVKVMTEQASALTQLAHASHVQAQAMDRLADASQIQARAIDRLASTFDTISAATHDVRNSIVDIDVTMKRYYTTSPT